MRENITAVIVAAGTAQRMQGIDKALTPVDGIPLLLRTVNAVAASERIDRIVVVTRTDLIETAKMLCKDCLKVTDVVVGGENRPQSVMNGLLAANDAELIAVHDGARPLVTVQVIDDAIAAAEKYGAAAPAIPVHDTIKTAKDGFVAQTPDRSTLFAIQTPQVFRAELIKNALQAAIGQKLPITDDCSAVELYGASVFLTKGSVENIKVTVPLDLAVAEAILKRRDAT